MKKFNNLIVFMIFMVAVVFSVTAQTPENLPVAERWGKWIAEDSTVTLDLSVANDGVATINVEGNGTSYNHARAFYSYTAKANTSYVYVLEMWTESGTRNMPVEYYQDYQNSIYFAKQVSLTNRRTTHTIVGKPIPNDGIYTLQIVCSNQPGKLYVRVVEIREATPEEITRASWDKWVADDSTATLDYSVARDGVVTVNIGGRAETNRWHRWKANVQYEYTAEANTRYTYVFEAWTQRGNRDLDINYYGDHVDDVYLMDTVSITNRRTTYTVTGLPIPKAGNLDLEFRGADQLGTFYVKILEIREATPEEITRSNWRKWVVDDSTATLDYSVANDGVVTVNVGGRASNRRWDAQVSYNYQKKMNTKYTYVFEAWTQRGNRELEIGYYHNHETGIGLVADPITITNRRTTYTFTGQPIPREDMGTGIWFACADQLGIFYVRIIEIREARPGDELPENIPVAQRWRREIAQDSTATLDYTIEDDGMITVNVGGRAESHNERGGWNRWKASVNSRYTARANTRYTYVFEAWTQRGNRELNIQYYGNHHDDQWVSLGDSVSITNRRTTYTVTGQPIPQDGTFKLEFHCADQLGTFYVRIIEIREATPEEIVRASWRKWVPDDSTATLNFSIANDGVVTVNIGGTATPQSEHWKTELLYQYTAKANTSYTYVFEAWTQSGTRDLGIRYWWENIDPWGLYTDPITITTRRTTFTITGQPIPKDGHSHFSFFCADQLGTFYVRIIEIREN